MQNHFETPQEIRQQIWKELGRATRDRHHAWRTPVLASAGSGGAVNARTVVLREVDVARQTLSIYTDSRSPKVSELANQPNALFIFWSTRLNWQLRVRVTMAIQTTGPHIEALWQRVQQSPSAADYLRSEAPGSPCSQAQSPPTAPQINPNFALLSAEVHEIDWLELGRGGHRRAQVLADTWQWLTP